MDNDERVVSTKGKGKISRKWKLSQMQENGVGGERIRQSVEDRYYRCLIRVNFKLPNITRSESTSCSTAR